MKKIIVILAVLILVVATASAAELIKLRTQVDSKDPIFVLKAGLSPESLDRAISDDESNNTLGWEEVEKSIQAEDITVYFQIIQKGTAGKAGEKYTLTVEASAMEQILNEDGTVLDAGKTPHETSKGIISGDESRNASNLIVEATKKGAAIFEAAYEGKVLDGTTIATFSVTWKKDIDAPDGIYQATVSLIVDAQ